MNKLRLIGCVFYVLLTSNLLSQQVIATQGNSSSNSTATLDYTIGEVVIMTGTDNQNHITQGFHQPIFEITTIDNTEICCEVNIYPNPTIEQLNIQVKEIDQFSRFDIFDVNGKLLNTRLIDQNNMQLSFYKYATGVYFISFISTENQLIRTFKVQKSY